MKKFWIVFVVLAVVVGGGFGFVWYVARGLQEHVSVPGGVLVWKVDGSLPEERDESFWGQVRSGGAEATFSETLFGLMRAAEDDRIKGLVMDIRAADMDWAKIGELRGAVAAFREQGKPVVAYLEAGFTRDYALATAAGRIVLAPEANLMVLGLSAEMAFLKDTLGKLGMEADFVHVGAYKSAPERMTRSSASPANREMVESIVGDQFDALLDMLAEGRNTDRDEAVRWVDQGLFDGPGAVEAGLADTLMYYDDMLDAEFPEDDVTFLEDYLLESPRQVHARKVAMVFVTGVIMPGESRYDNLQGKIAGSDSIIEDLQSAADDKSIAAVILRVDSPGGSALASDLIWHEITELKKQKPVIVSMSGLAASGGYYVSCLGDSIFADPGTLTGSIGVFAGKMNRQQMYRKIGVNREFVTRGENALLFSDEGGFTDSQRTLFQAQLDGFYGRFLGKVADGRRMERDDVHQVAQGRVWTGRQGVQRGLVDGLGGLRRSLDAAKRRLGVAPEAKVTVLTYAKPMTFLERMLLRSLRDGGLARLASRSGLLDRAPELGRAASAAELMTGGLVRALRDDGTLAAAAMLDGRPLALMPFSVRIR